MRAGDDGKGQVAAAYRVFLSAPFSEPNGYGYGSRGRGSCAVVGVGDDGGVIFANEMDEFFCLSQGEESEENIGIGVAGTTNDGCDERRVPDRFQKVPPHALGPWHCPLVSSAGSLVVGVAVDWSMSRGIWNTRQLSCVPVCLTGRCYRRCSAGKKRERDWLCGTTTRNPRTDSCLSGELWAISNSSKNE